jgi:hypothetical protein
MSALTKQQKQTLYMNARQHTGLTSREWGRLFTLDSTDGSREVTKKENPLGSANSRGCNLSDALAAQLLVLVGDAGYDINQFTFDEAGLLKNTPKKKK